MSYLFWVRRILHFLKQDLSFSKVMIPSRMVLSLSGFLLLFSFLLSLSSSLLKDMLCLPVRFSCWLKVLSSLEGHSKVL